MFLFACSSSSASPRLLITLIPIVVDAITSPDGKYPVQLGNVVVVERKYIEQAIKGVIQQLAAFPTDFLVFRGNKISREEFVALAASFRINVRTLLTPLTLCGPKQRTNLFVFVCFLGLCHERRGPLHGPHLPVHLRR